jgi:hypothetical protein
VKVATEFIYPPIPIRTHDWTAYYPDLYDGAPDAGPQFVGYGETEADALRDLAEQMADDWLERGERLANAFRTWTPYEEARYELRERERMDRLEVRAAMKEQA